MKRILEHFHPCSRLNRKREQYVKQTTMPEHIKALVQTPRLEAAQFAQDANYIVLDLETTGLDSEEDLILSIGWVDIANGKVELATSQHMYINSDSQIKPETAVINHITPQMLSEGVSIHDAMRAFFHAAKGKILVAHACVVETQFINQYLQRVFKLSEPPLVWLDTMCIEKHLQKAINPRDEIDVTLSGTRARYGLPEYNGHNALADAVATAELLLAQKTRITPQGKTTIGTLYRLSL
ncbi:3'-5' exonuclease [Vibrio rotiferianus]|uniref:3'-5' exonuclease n=1 Tax=Vibrio rotiferianus TaxID=190895 RepID=UPI00148E16BD|nr:3'-5' exonuclease [Vibrio rotiferianus]NOH67283.1 3'-5' exonuclease [Vibrio rotiferianus]